MTTRHWIVLALSLVVAACVTGRSTRRGGLSPERIASYPTEVQESYELFATRCSRCHTLSRPLDAAITEYEHWRNYVNRMRHHAGSGISRADGEKILVFLKHYAAEKSAEQSNESQSEPPSAAPPPSTEGAAAQ